MQYYKKSNAFIDNGPTLGDILERALARRGRVWTRDDKSIPGCVPAQDIWVFNDDPARDPDRLYMTIKNPSKPYRPAY